MTDEREMLSRWRLILGQFAEENLPLDGSYSGEDECLAYLYDHEYTEGRGIRSKENSPDRSGGRGGSVFSVPEWLGKVKKLFPKNTAEILQKDALNKYGINEMLANPEILQSLEPDMNLLTKLLSFRGVIPPAVRAQADVIIKKAAEEISKKLENNVRKCFYGRRTSGAQSYYRVFRNFDFKRTVEYNLKNYSEEYNTIIPHRLYFNNTVKRYNPWDIIILADQSGSMMNSVIHTAIMVAILAKLPFLKVRLFVFDTNIADMSEYVGDCTDILMKVQLGGGTDIYKALCCAQGCIERPQQTIVILISDLYDGMDIRRVYRKCSDILESGSRLMVLPALDYCAEPVYNRPAAAFLAKLGADVAAITPEELANWIGKIIL